MNAENFCYWLQGWLEIQNPVTINALQLQEIKNHLSIVTISATKIAPLYVAIDTSKSGCGAKIPDITGNYSVCGQDKSYSTLNFSGISGLKIGITSLLGEDQKEKESKETYITITNHPVWYSGSYSNYTYEFQGEKFKHLHELLYQDLEINFHKRNPKDVYLVVDNDLQPMRHTNIKNLTVYSPNHLVGSPTSGCGLNNVGTYGGLGLFC